MCSVIGSLRYHNFTIDGFFELKHRSTRWAHVSLQLWVHKTEFTLVLLFINYCIIFLFLKDFIYLFIFREGKGGRKKGRETSMCDSLLRALPWGPSLQPSHVPWLRIEPATLWFTGQHPIHWATPARAYYIIFHRNNCKPTFAPPCM